MRKIILIILSYIFIFNPVPPALGIGSVKFLFLLLPLLLIKPYSYSLNKLRPFVLPYILILLYILVRTLMGGYAIILYTSIVSFFEVILISFIIIKIHHIYRANVLQTFYACGIIAICISIISFLSPSFNNFIKSYLSMMPDKDQLFYAFRGFGMGSELTFSYAIEIAVIFSVFLLKNKLNIKLFIAVLFAALAILINARTGALVLLIGIGMYAMTNIKKSLGYGIIVFVSLPLVFATIEAINPETFDYMEQFYLELGDFLTGTENARADTAGTLLDSQVNYGNSFSEWFFGRGIHLYTVEREKRTDNGYDNQFVYGGICYLLLLAVLLYVMFIKCWRREKLIAFFLLLTVLLVNIKGEFVPTASGFRLVACLFMYFGVFNINKELMKS